jgi:hypothetical protein
MVYIFLLFMSQAASMFARATRSTKGKDLVDEKVPSIVRQSSVTAAAGASVRPPASPTGSGDETKSWERRVRHWKEGPNDDVRVSFLPSNAKVDRPTFKREHAILFALSVGIFLGFAILQMALLISLHSGSRDPSASAAAAKNCSLQTECAAERSDISMTDSLEKMFTRYFKKFLRRRYHILYYWNDTARIESSMRVVCGNRKTLTTDPPHEMTTTTTMTLIESADASSADFQEPQRDVYQSYTDHPLYASLNGNRSQSLLHDEDLFL